MNLTYITYYMHLMKVLDKIYIIPNLGFIKSYFLEQILE